MSELPYEMKYYNRPKPDMTSKEMRQTLVDDIKKMTGGFDVSPLLQAYKEQVCREQREICADFAQVKLTEYGCISIVTTSDGGLSYELDKSTIKNAPMPE
jgi:hypothetical protein